MWVLKEICPKSPWEVVELEGFTALEARRGSERTSSRRKGWSWQGLHWVNREGRVSPAARINEGQEARLSGSTKTTSSRGWQASRKRAPSDEPGEGSRNQAEPASWGVCFVPKTIVDH